MFRRVRAKSRHGRRVAYSPSPPLARDGILRIFCAVNSPLKIRADQDECREESPASERVGRRTRLDGKLAQMMQNIGQETGYCQERPDGISSAVPILDSSEYKTVSADAVSPFALSFALHRRKHSRRGFRRRPHSLYPLSLFCTPPNPPKPTLILFRKSFAMFGYATALILAAAAPSALATVYVSPPNSLHSTPSLVLINGLP